MVKSAEKSPKYNPAGGMDGTRQCGTFIDWRGLPIAHAAALALGLTPLNLVVGRKRTPAWEVSTALNMSCCRFSRKGPPHMSTTFLLASEAAIARTCGSIRVPPQLDQMPARVSRIIQR